MVGDGPEPPETAATGTEPLCARLNGTLVWYAHPYNARLTGEQQKRETTNEGHFDPDNAGARQAL